MLLQKSSWALGEIAQLTYFLHRSGCFVFLAMWNDAMPIIAPSAGASHWSGTPLSCRPQVRPSYQPAAATTSPRS